MTITKTDIENSKMSVKNFKKWENSLGKNRNQDYVSREFEIRTVNHNDKEYPILFDNYYRIYGYDKFMPIDQPYTLTDFRGIDKMMGETPKSSITEATFKQDEF